jgi:hypothetical protein
MSMPTGPRLLGSVLLGSAVLVAALATAGPSSSLTGGASPVPVAGSHPARPDGRRDPGSTVVTGAERRAARAATATFRTAVTTEASAFVGAVDRLESELTTGDVPRSQLAELTAQSDFDPLRSLGTAYTGNAAALDEPADAVGPGQSFGGLHAVEQALWSPGVSPRAATTAAVTASSGLAAEAPVTEYLLDKLRLEPEAIGTTALQELDWVTEVALPGREEAYSHRDDVDVSATVGASAQAFRSIEPLAALVDPVGTSRLARQYTALVTMVAALGPPVDVVDADIPAATRLQLSQQVDATAALLGQLSARLAPFGAGGNPP